MVPQGLQPPVSHYMDLRSLEIHNGTNAISLSLFHGKALFSGVLVLPTMKYTPLIALVLSSFSLLSFLLNDAFSGRTSLVPEANVTLLCLQPHSPSNLLSIPFQSFMGLECVSFKYNCLNQ